MNAMTSGPIKPQQDYRGSNFNKSGIAFDKYLESPMTPASEYDSPLYNDSSPLMGQNEPLQGFGNYENYSDDGEVFTHEGPCLLKTKTDRYKEHWCVLNGNELYCYRKKEDA